MTHSSCHVALCCVAKRSEGSLSNLTLLCFGDFAVTLDFVATLVVFDPRKFSFLLKLVSLCTSHAPKHPDLSH